MTEKPMDDARYSLVGECTSGYEVTELDNGCVEIRILVTPSYRNLWLVKLSELSRIPERNRRIRSALAATIPAQLANHPPPSLHTTLRHYLLGRSGRVKTAVRTRLGVRSRHGAQNLCLDRDFSARRQRRCWRSPRHRSARCPSRCGDRPGCDRRLCRYRGPHRPATAGFGRYRRPVPSRRRR